MFFLIFSALQMINVCKFLSASLSVADQCINVCQNVQLPILEPNSYEDVVCQSGCKFFNIIKLGGALNASPALKHCYISCRESYNFATEQEVCTLGCNLMAAKRQTDMSRFLMLASEEESKSDLVLSEPETEILETDLLSDPSIKSQLEIGFNVDYKIPETHIRTMPIENDEISIEQNKQKDSGDWLDCASRNSGVPRWILLYTMLGVILVAVWLILSMERRKGHEDGALDDDLLVEIADEKTLLEAYVFEKSSNLENDSLVNVTSDNEVTFSAPPRYSVICDNDIDLPKYSEVVQQENREQIA